MDDERTPMDRSTTVASRLGQLTLEEKAALCLGSDFWHTAPVPRLGVPAVMMSDGPHGLRRQPDDADHAGGGESLPATCFPTASALGSSWDPELVRRVGAAIGDEARAQGVAVVLGPGINLKRSPLCGRNFEYLSEDPLLSGVLGAALVEGIQSRGVGACVKHFAANNQETDRLRVSAEVDERTLRELYLPGFERVVTQARPWMVMCAYNRLNGVHCSQHPWLLTDVLRGEWGFDGVVVSDWGAVHDRVAALAAGLDLEMPPNLGVSDAALVAAVRDGRLPESVLDAAVARVLALVDRALAAGDGPEGTGSDPDGSGGDPDGPAVDPDAHHRLAREAARECAVLLKNDGGLLPLRPEPGEVVAVIGEFARTARYQGAGSSQVNPTRVESALDELRAALPPGVEVRFAPGFRIDDLSGAERAEAETETERLAAEAERLAAGADVVVAFLGLPAQDESEGFDRTHLELPVAQTALLARLAAVTPRIVVVLANGSAVRVEGWEQHAAALLECWLSGQGSGGAAADLLLGVADPSGRLAETLPLRLQDTPAYLNFPGEAGRVRYGEGVFVGYRGYDALDRPVSYPFGHGLAYTTFGYADLAVSVTGTADGGDLAVTVSCTVTNTGTRAGREVVQLYVGDPRSTLPRPPRELKGFAKVALEPGESRPVTFRLDARDLSAWSPVHGRWVLEAGTFELAVGASSRDLRLVTTLEVDAAPARVPLDRMATLQEWLADPDASAELHRAVGVDATGRPRGIVGDAELQRVIGNFPLSSLAAFPGLGIDHALVDDLVARFGPVQPSGAVQPSGPVQPSGALGHSSSDGRNSPPAGG